MMGWGIGINPFEKLCNCNFIDMALSVQLSFCAQTARLKNQEQRQKREKLLWEKLCHSIT